jgi:hypothetical protein
MSDIRSLALSRAYELVEAGKSDEARTVLEPILQNAPDNVDAWWIYAHAVTDPDDARRALENVVRIDPHYAGATDLLQTLNDEYPLREEAPLVPEPVIADTVESDVPEVDEEPEETYAEQRTYEPARVPAAEEPSRSWLPVAIVAGIIVLLFVVLVLILPSLTGPALPTPTVASVSSNTTPQPTTPLLLDETEEIVQESPAATSEALTIPVGTVAPTEEQPIVATESTPGSDIVSTDTPLPLSPNTPLPALETATPEEQETTIVIVATDTQSATEQLVTPALTAQLLPTESPAAEVSTQPSAVPATTRTTMSDATEATAEAESVSTDVTEVEYTEYLSEALQSFALADPSIEQAQTSYGDTVLARVCTSEGPLLRETLRSVMDILSNEADVIPQDIPAIGVRLINCDDDRTLRIISVDRASASAYVAGDAGESEFEAQWRAQ